MEHGVWKPAGVAVMIVFGVLGAIGLATAMESLFEICSFLFLTGLASYLYGVLERKEEAGSE
jgi:hypothetical protein